MNETFLKNKKLVGISVAALVVYILAFYPVLKSLILTWYNNEDYSHGFLIIPVSLYIIWEKRHFLAQVPRKASQSGLVFIILSLVIYAFAQITEVASLSSFSMIMLLAAVVIYLFGFTMLKELSFPLAFLLFMIPVPSQIYSALTINLQLFVTEASAWLAPLLGISLYHEGNVIHLPHRTLQVVNACSGMRSIISLLAMSSIVAYFYLRSNPLRWVLFILGIPVAVVTNIVRVLVLIAAFHYFNSDLTAGTAHTVLGLVIFALALALTILLMEVLRIWEKKFRKELSS
jgi:exosortase